MVKTLESYLDDVQEQFPFMCKDDLKTILEFGLSRYLKANRLHGDVLLRNKVEDNMLIHCGRLGYDALANWYRWHTKWRMKERILSKFREEPWDGYYYIGLDDKEQEIISKQGKNKTFTKVHLVKLKKEFHHEKWCKHIWRIPWPIDCGWKFFVDKVSSDKAEYVESNNYEDYHQCFLGRFNNGHASTDNQEQLVDGCIECDTKNI